MRLLLLGLFLLLFNTGYGQQNLVPNPSFEIFDTCPDNLGQIQRANGWMNWGVYNSTPDFYNSCDTGIVSGWNSNGIHQIAHTGNGFAAVYTFYWTNLYREFIGIQLDQSLIIGSKYYLSFYAVTGENWGYSLPTNNLGILLSTVPYSASNPVTCNDFSHLKSDSLIADTVNWTYISGSIIADSAYNYLIIGNFYANSNTDTLLWLPVSFAGYYGIDDVCLSTDSNACRDITFNKEMRSDNVNIYPNPTTNSFFIEGLALDDYSFTIYDLLGNVIVTESCNSCTSHSVNLELLPSGYYLLVGRGIKDHKVFHKKISKI